MDCCGECLRNRFPSPNFSFPHGVTDRPVVVKTSVPTPPPPHRQQTSQWWLKSVSSAPSSALAYRSPVAWWAAIISKCSTWRPISTERQFGHDSSVQSAGKTRTLPPSSVSGALLYLHLFPFYRFSNGSPAGLDNLYIDYFLLNIIQLTPKSVSTVQVRSDGFWRLSPPLMWQLPPGIDQWQPIIGPPTQAFAFALQIGPTILMAQPSQPHLAPFQSQQQRPVIINGLEAAGQTPGRRSCGTMASPTTAETPTPSLAYSGLESSSGGLQNPTVKPHHQPPSNQWNSGETSITSITTHISLVGWVNIYL